MAVADGGNPLGVEAGRDWTLAACSSCVRSSRVSGKSSCFCFRGKSSL